MSKVTWVLAVTATEAVAINAANVVAANIRTDSQYQISDADRAARAAGEAARKTAIDRHNAWDSLWNSAKTDAERAAIELAATVSERGMLRITAQF